MLNWLCLNVVALMNMVGILMDIAGAFFVAYEVIRKFHGEKYEEGIGSGPIGGVPANDPPIETQAFRLFERRRFQGMKVGLVLLTMGFALQFLANALQLKSATPSIERTPSGLRPPVAAHVKRHSILAQQALPIAQKYPFGYNEDK